MRKFFAKLGGWIFAVAFWTWFVVDLTLDLVGKSTAPEDWRILMDEKMPALLQWLFSTPGWVPGLLAALLTSALVYLNWSQRPTLAGASTDPWYKPLPDAYIGQGHKEKTPGLRWNFENSPGYYFLGMKVDSRNEVMVHQFQGTVTNKTTDPLTSVSAHLRSDSTGETFPVLFQADGPNFVSSDKLHSLPVDAHLNMRAYFSDDQSPISYDEFMSRIGPFTFFFKYNGREYRYSFSKAAISDRKKAYVATVEKSREKLPAPIFKQEKAEIPLLPQGTGEKTQR